jgi:hypothetical protein
MRSSALKADIFAIVVVTEEVRGTIVTKVESAWKRTKTKRTKKRR